MSHWNRHTSANGRSEWKFDNYTLFYAEVRKMAERPLNVVWRDDIDVFG